MTDKRYTAVLATLFDSAADATLDYAVSRHNIHKMVFLLSLIAGIGQVAIGAFIGIDCTFKALPYVALHGILILLGYICFLKALKYTPIALIGLVQSSELFFTTIVDCMLGYLTLSVRFLALLSLFVFAIALFYTNCIKNENTSVKEVKPIGIVLTLSTMFLYVVATYLIKVSAAYGASEITLNLVLETIFYVLETFSFINDTPTIVMAIKQMGIFVMFFLSVLFKTDKFTPQKLIALILGFIAITGLYFN